MSQRYKPPKPGNCDLPDTVARHVASLFPGGSVLVDLLRSPIDRRRQQWMDMIANGLRRLEEKFENLSVGSIVEDDEFVSAVLQATQSAIRTHDVEKLEALRNAVLNVASGKAPSDDLQLIFLRYIDEFTSWHLRILAFLRNPREYGEVRGISYPSWSTGALKHVLEHAFTEIKGQREFYDQIILDLRSRGLIAIDSLHVMMTERGMFEKRTTGWGDVFLDLILSPIDQTDE